MYFDEQRAGAAGLRSVDDTWWAQVVRRLGARALANASYSGSMVAGAGFPAGLSRERSAALRGPLGEAPTDVLVFMGTNDYGWGSARAQAAGRSAATPDAVDLAAVPCGVASGALPSDLDDFEAAYAAMLANIASACPGAALWCVGLLPGRVAASDGPTFTWNLRGIPLGDYNEAIGRAACSKGAVFLDGLLRPRLRGDGRNPSHGPRDGPDSRLGMCRHGRGGERPPQVSFVCDAG